MKVSITRALAELKLLDSKITRKIAGTKFATQNKVNNNRIDGVYSKDEYDTHVKSEYQSITDLISRRSSFKSMIVKSNAETIVKIGEKSMSVAEAIERKDSIKYDKMMLAQLQQSYNYALSRTEQENFKEQTKLDNLLVAQYGADAKTGKTPDIAATTEGFWKTNQWLVIDPLNLKNKIEKLQSEIEEFENNVDFVLSEINSRTDIEVPD
jgi:hypothetical protein